MDVKQIFIASDHAGLDLKNKIVNEFKSFPIEDLGPNSEDSVDYPDYAHKLCEKLKSNPDAFGVLVCGSGQGMAMAANKHAHVRAALCWTPEIAKLSREHNNANVLCMGSRVIEHSVGFEIFKTFFDTDFEGGRHQRRVSKINI